MNVTSSSHMHTAQAPNVAPAPAPYLTFGLAWVALCTITSVRAALFSLPFCRQHITMRVLPSLANTYQRRIRHTISVYMYSTLHQRVDSWEIKEISTDHKSFNSFSAIKYQTKAREKKRKEKNVAAETTTRERDGYIHSSFFLAVATPHCVLLDIVFHAFTYFM